MKAAQALHVCPQSFQLLVPSLARPAGSHYSSAGIVLFYLIRLQPFTKLNRALQARALGG